MDFDFHDSKETLEKVNATHSKRWQIISVFLNWLWFTVLDWFCQVLKLAMEIDEPLQYMQSISDATP